MCRTILGWIAVGVLSGCVAPVNLTYESAKVLNEDAWDVQGNVSAYYYPGDYGLTNLNYGLKLGYGITDRYTMKLRYEHLKTPDMLGFVRDLVPDADPVYWEMHYFEIESKLALNRPGRTIGLPIAYYSTGAFSFDPRFYFTFKNSRKTVDFSFIPKVHMFFGDEPYLIPGISVGFGFSSDLDRWAFRPEVGWAGFFAIGVALNYRLSPPRRKEE